MPVIALSLTEQIEKFGAYAGLAAFFGLAVLTVLYFAQAREVKRLREWAGRAPERAAELEARVAADAARRAATPQRQPPARAAPAAPAVAAGAGAAMAAKPATAAAGAPPVNGPAKSGEAATTVTPAGTPAGKEAAAAQAAPAEAGSPAAIAPSPATDGGDQGDDDAGHEAGADDPGQQPAEATAGKDAAANGAGERVPTAAPVRRATPEPQRAAAPDASAGERPEPAPARRPAPSAPLRQTGPATRRPVQPPRRPATPGPATPGPAAESRGRGRMLLVVLGGLAAVVVALLVATQLFGGDAEQSSPNVPAEVEPTPEGGADDGSPAAGSRADTTVAVLNGTTVTGLAATIMDKITEAGFAQGKTDNYSDQARSASLVFFAEGARERAEEIARLIDLPAGDVEPMTPDIEALAGEEAGVVVVVGNDQAQ